MENDKRVVKWIDPAMFTAVPINENHDEPVLPSVTLVSATSMPLRTMAAATALYEGKIRVQPEDVTTDEAQNALAQMSKTALKSGLEFIDFHFFIEGVTRAFTHQLVRQRVGASYIQESMRFAVKEDAAFEVALPPSLAGLKDDDPKRVVWEEHVRRMGETYMRLVNSGVPAEDARGLLPTNITTRIHYKTTLRGLAEHAGLRLCTQAQFEWRLVWMEIIKAISGYSTDIPWMNDNWEFRAIANMFRPICYRQGSCAFMADVDRFCVIRDRVQAHAAKGERSDTWTDINPAEWMLNPKAARAEQGEFK